MLKRYITDSLKEKINYSPVVALLGPRQIGKTTLALHVASTTPSIYLDLESPADLVKLSDPEQFLLSQSDKLIILDEIQRMPDIFSILRGIVDKRRRLGQQGKQFLILGSASMDLLRQSSESLAGRISYMDMYGLTPLEISNIDENKKSLSKLRLRGGFPNSFLAENDMISTEWRENFIKTYLERDIPQMGFKIPSIRLRRLWTMLAHLQGEVVNFSSLSQSLEIDSKTVSYYIEILTDLLLVRRLQPWFANTKKRLVKSPRYYVRDSGILHRLLDINTEEDLASHPVNGKSFEGFVIENIISVLPINCTPYFYRTAVGAEIDLLLKFSANEVWAIEIKKGLTPKVKPGFYSACKDINATKKFVVYSGEESFPLKNDVMVISLTELMKKLLEKC